MNVNAFYSPGGLQIIMSPESAGSTGRFAQWRRPSRHKASCGAGCGGCCDHCNLFPILKHIWRPQNEMAGWWLGHPSEKYEFVNWDDDIPKSYGKTKNGNQTTNQKWYWNGPKDVGVSFTDFLMKNHGPLTWASSFSGWTGRDSLEFRGFVGFQQTGESPL